MESKESSYLLLSGIQHFEFCKRQWALIHIEQQWEDNVKTIEGHYLHRNVDQSFSREKRGNKVIVRSLPVKSSILKITGICDVVEFIEDENQGVFIPKLGRNYSLYPVEYKRGKPKKGDEDNMQLIAQAMCLEEMFLTTINYGYVYYEEIKHRITVEFTDELRKKVISITDKMHAYFEKRYTPKVKVGPSCKRCSLVNICLPTLMNKRTVKSYIDGMIKDEKTS